MDPEANLAEQLKIARSIIRDADADMGLDHDNAERLAELVIALDEWISRGGFLPAKWRR